MFLNLLALNLKLPASFGQAGLEASGRLSEQLVSHGYWGDMIILMVAIIVVFLFGFLLDGHNILIAFLSAYAAWLLALFFPYETFGTGALFVTAWWFRLVLIVVAMALAASVLSATHLIKAYYKYNFLARWGMAVINGILFSGLLASLFLSVLPVSFLTQFSKMSLNIFTGELGRFLWVLLPLVGIFLTRKRRRNPGRPMY